MKKWDMRHINPSWFLFLLHSQSKENGTSSWKLRLNLQSDPKTADSAANCVRATDTLHPVRFFLLSIWMICTVEKKNLK